MAPIHDLARNCDVEGLRHELERGVDPSLSESLQTPLHVLCERRGEEARLCCRLLIDYGASVNARDEIGDPLLVDACLWRNAALVSLLLEAGADINAAGYGSRTALHVSAGYGYVACVRLLLRAGAAVNTRNHAGKTPLDYAIDRIHGARSYPILLRAGAELPAETEDPYIQKVIDAGGWANYRDRHLDRLALMLTPKPDAGRRRSRRRLSPLRRLPPELVRRVVAYAFHVGDY